MNCTHCQSTIVPTVCPAFMPKVSCNYNCLALELVPPFTSMEEWLLHHLCPVRALHIYLDRTRACHKSDQLFVSWPSPCKGRPLSRQRLSHWIVQAIILAYNSKCLQCPEGLRAHSTIGMGTVLFYKRFARWNVGPPLVFL